MKDPNEFFNKYPKDPGIFDFDKLQARPLYQIIPYEAELEFHKIATTLSLNSDLQKKYRLMDDLARRLDLTFMARGTNRSVYTVNYDSSIIIKIGYDKAGITDSAREFENQQFIKPFCTKCFEVSPTGTIGLFERVTPIKHIEEFKSMAPDIFDMLYKKVLGKYIMADIGMDQYMNYGFREGFGPVILDYPYMYELDESKLRCRNISIATGEMCNGKIDYDDCFEHLVCDTCGREYNARDLAKEIQHQKDRVLYKGLMEESKMRIRGYGANASFDSEKGGKVETKVETVALPPPSKEPSKEESSKKEAESVTYISAEEAQRMVQEAYLSGMVDGKNKAEEQQAHRSFNPTGESADYAQKRSKFFNRVGEVVEPKPEQPAQQPTQQTAQSKPEQPKSISPQQPKKNTVTIETDNYVPYRDPVPRGKGRHSGYKGWQTPRNTGRPLHIRQQPPSKPEGSTPQQKQSQGQQQPRQPQGQQRPVSQKPQQSPIPQPKPNAPKPREPYQPKQQAPQQSVQTTPPKKERSENSASQQQKPSVQQQPKQPNLMTSNEAFQYQPSTRVRTDYQQPFVGRATISEPSRSANSYDSVVANKIMKHVLLFCVENAERRDDVIYELTYITTLYHIDLDSKFDVPMKSITDVVRKIVDLIEERLENSGIKIEYEYDDNDRYHSEDNNDIPGTSRTFLGGDLEAITDDQEDQLSYNDRLRNNGISFRDEIIPVTRSNDQISEEVGNIFNTRSAEQVQQVAENLDSNAADPNDTSISQELADRINNQLNKVNN